ncbi:MAG: phosphatase PAP2 family protein [Bacteroidetes bacterium]|nr:phosphatase PAP2 family protein [Bacteroidota bacterium]
MLRFSARNGTSAYGADFHVIAILHHKVLIESTVPRQPRSSLNPWFVFPFLVWVLIGGILLLVFNKSQLFLSINRHHNEFLDVLMRGLTFMGDGAGIVVVLLLLMWLFPACRNRWYVLAAVSCTVFPTLLIQLIKSLAQAPRPLEFFKLELLQNPSWLHIRPEWPHLYQRSFPSGHSGGVFSLCCFLSMMLPFRRRWFGLLLLLFACAVAYSRLYLAAHFYLDIFVGSLIGASVSALCFELIQLWSRGALRLENQQMSFNQPH